MRLYRAERLAAADAAAAAGGTATTTLMARAGEAVAAAALEHWPAARRVLVLCGPGNNGGDGFVAAQALAAAGRAVMVAELRPGTARGDAAWARTRLVEADAANVRWLGAEASRALPLEGVGLVIDALFGTGLRRALDGTAAAWVEAVRAAGVPVLAVDVPSGVDADRARPPGPHVHATRTLQLAGAVPASLLGPARVAFGLTSVVNIGIPEAIAEREADGVAVDADWLRQCAPRRGDDCHKYRAGAVLVVGGSRRYAGAPELAARGAYRAGAGLVTLVARERAPCGWPEVVWEPPEPNEAAPEAAQRLLTSAEGRRRATAAVLGPGFSGEVAALEPLLDALTGPVVLDAGALDPALCEAARRHRRCVLTPHAGEAARLLAAIPDADAIDAAGDPVAAATTLAAAWRAVCVLKGPGTVVAAPDGRWAISAAGTPALASAGSGDVLAGVIGAFLASDPGADPWRLAAAAAELHGLAGAVAAERGPGVVASDVADALGPALRRCLQGSC